MVMLSPRSYITGAFDVLYNPLTEYVYKQLSGNRSDWWEAYVLKAEGAVFREMEAHEPLPDKGDLKTIRDFYDEYYLLKFVLRREIKKLFSEEVVGMFAILLRIRNDWAHRNIQTTSQASRAITQMIGFANLLGFPSAARRLVNLRVKLQTDEIERNLKLSTRESLIGYLDEKIFSAIEGSPNASAEALRIAKSSRNQLEGTKTAEEVVEFLWNAIRKKSHAYTAIKDCGLPTFEDIRDEFFFMCYGRIL